MKHARLLQGAALAALLAAAPVAARRVPQEETRERELEPRELVAAG